MMKKFKLGLAVATLLSGLGQAAHAACPADGATPFTASAVTQQNGFAAYVQDSQGLALELCLDPAFCFFDPPVPGNQFSSQIGFGAEAFWWLSEATLSTALNLDALVVMAAEAAFAFEVPTDGEQFPFTRLRIWVDVPFPGIYTVTHPYGQERFVVETVAPGQEIRESFDIEFMPNAVNRGRVGPWLTWDTYNNPDDPNIPNVNIPGGGSTDAFVGDAATPHAVKGSPCGTNFFRVEAVELDGITPLPIDFLDEDGDGLTNRITTDLFVTSGKTYPHQVDTPLVVDAATYSRGADGRVNVFATAPSTAEVTFSGGAVGTAGEQPALGDGAGRFFGSAALGTVPGTVQVTATNVAQPNNASITRTVGVSDVVTILQADYDNVAKTLTVVASSSDQGVTPTLDAGLLGILDCTNPASCTLMAIGLNVAPASVMVQSSAGGSATKAVRVLN